MAEFRILYGDALRFEWAVGALPCANVRLALEPFLPVFVLGLADQSSFPKDLDLLSTILPLILGRWPEVGKQRLHAGE